MLTAAAQAWPEGGSFADDVRFAAVSGGFGEFAARVGGQWVAVPLLGTLFGLVAATMTFLVLTASLMLMYAVDAKIGLRVTITLMTLIAAGVTAAFALPITGSMDATLITGVAATLPGVCSVLTARWCLAPPQAPPGNSETPVRLGDGLADNPRRLHP